MPLLARFRNVVQVFFILFPPLLVNAVENLGTFGEFTLASGEKVIGIYHLDDGTFELYTPTKVVPLKPTQIITQRCLESGIEPEPATLEDLEARLATLSQLIIDRQSEIKRFENQRSEQFKEQMMRKLELAKREQGNKEAQDLLNAEPDAERKKTYATLCSEHLSAIAAAHGAIAELESALQTTDARINAVANKLDNLNTRAIWLTGRRSRFSNGK